MNLEGSECASVQVQTLFEIRNFKLQKFRRAKKEVKTLNNNIFQTYSEFPFAGAKPH